MLSRWTNPEVGKLVSSVAQYTRFVRSTKVTVAGLAFLLIILMLFYPIFRKDESGVRIAFTSIQKGEASPTKMINAKFNGMDKNNQPYHVNADTATQIDENTVDMVKVTADIMLNSGRWLSVAANTGTFSMQNHMLQLDGAVDMFSDDGYEFRTQHMTVDMNTKMATSQLPVEGQGPMGTLNAEHGVVIDSKTKTANFTGPIKVVVYPPAQSANADTPNASAKEGKN